MMLFQVFVETAELSRCLTEDYILLSGKPLISGPLIKTDRWVSACEKSVE